MGGGADRHYFETTEDIRYVVRWLREHGQRPIAVPHLLGFPDSGTGVLFQSDPNGPLRAVVPGDTLAAGDDHSVTVIPPDSTRRDDLEG